MLRVTHGRFIAYAVIPVYILGTLFAMVVCALFDVMKFILDSKI